MNENVTKYVPYGAAVVGALLGNVLYKKYPKFGMVGRVLAIGAGVAGGYYVSKAIIKNISGDEFNNATNSRGCQDYDGFKCRRNIFNGICYCRRKEEGVIVS